MIKYNPRWCDKVYEKEDIENILLTNHENYIFDQMEDNLIDQTDGLMLIRMYEKMRKLILEYSPVFIAQTRCYYRFIIDDNGRRLIRTYQKNYWSGLKLIASEYR